MGWIGHRTFIVRSDMLRRGKAFLLDKVGNQGKKTMTISNSKRLWVALIGSTAGWTMVFLVVGLPIFHLGFKVSIATIASYMGICCAVQLGIVAWLLYVSKQPQRPDNWVVHRTVATTVFVTTVGLLFFYYIRRSRPGDPATHQFTSIGYGLTVLFAVLFLIKNLLSRSKGSSLDAISTQTEIKLAYRGFILAWFCFIFMVHEMNLPYRSISAWVLLAFAFAALCVMASGFVMRKKLFAQSAESLPGDLGKAIRHWRGAHFIGFSFAMNLTIFGAVLKFLGSSWYVAGIFFGLSLGLLLLWKPRELTLSNRQPA
jgi:hypothetical protein